MSSGQFGIICSAFESLFIIGSMLFVSSNPAHTMFSASSTTRSGYTLIWCVLKKFEGLGLFLSSAVCFGISVFKCAISLINSLFFIIGYVSATLGVMLLINSRVVAMPNRNITIGCVIAFLSNFFLFIFPNPKKTFITT